MSDNRIISKNKYIVTGISGISIDNNITKRPYTNVPASSRKRPNPPASFDNALNSVSLHNSSNDESTTFSNELENTARLKSEENSRLVQAKFKNNNNSTLETPISNINTAETELHNNLSQDTETKSDISTIYKKLELLKSLKHES